MKPTLSGKSSALSRRAKIGWTMLYALLALIGAGAAGYEFYLAWCTHI